VQTTNGHGPRRAILYARVSTDEQARSGYSLSQQLEALREYAAREGYEILDEVTDPGKSGATLDRPGLDRVRNLVASGRYRRYWPRTETDSRGSPHTCGFCGKS
jgi:site-specific DNA recombinase